MIFVIIIIYSLLYSHTIHTNMPLFLSFFCKSNKVVPETDVYLPIQYLEAKHDHHGLKQNKVVPTSVYVKHIQEKN